MNLLSVFYKHFRELLSLSNSCQAPYNPLVNVAPKFTRKKEITVFFVFFGIIKNCGVIKIVDTIDIFVVFIDSIYV